MPRHERGSSGGSSVTLTPPKMTWTGYFVIPLVLRRQENFNIQDVLLGDNTSKELPSASGKGVSELYYDENSSNNTDYRLNTLSMDDLEYCGQILFKNLAGLTSLQFLKLIASIGLNMGDLSNYNGILISAIPNLITLTFTELVHATNLVLTTLGASGAGVALSFPKLKYISNVGTNQGSLNIVSCKINGSINFPELDTISNFYLQQITGATAILLPKLKRTLSAFSMTTLSAITSIDFSLLEDVGGNLAVKAFGSSSSPITSLSFPALKKLRGTSASTFTDVNALALSMPAMVEYTSGVSFVGANKFTSAVFGTIGTLKKAASMSLIMATGQGLDLTSVNNLMKLLASLDGVNTTPSGTTVLYGGQTVNISGGNTPAPTFTGTTKTQLLNSTYKFDGSGTTATVTWPSHGYSNGDLITISGINSPFVGTFFITYISSTQFSFTIPSQQQAVSGTGTAVMKKTGSTPTQIANGTAEGFYYQQLLMNRGCTVTTN